MKEPLQKLRHICCGAALLLTTGLGLAQTVIVDTGLGTPVGSATLVPAGALLKVDSSGNRTVLSDFGNSSEGPIGSGSLVAITWMPSGLFGLGRTILVADSSAGTNGKGALFAVNTSTGARTILNDFGNASQGPIGGGGIKGVAVYPGEFGLLTTVFVIDSKAGTNGLGAVFEIDPFTGSRTVATDFGNSNQGPLGISLVSTAFVLAPLQGLPSELVVLDNKAGPNGIGAIFAVSQSGNRTILSDLGEGLEGEAAVAPQQVGVGTGYGDIIFVTDDKAGTNGQGALFQINAGNGSRALVSDFGNANEGEAGNGLSGVASDGNGHLLVIDDLLGSQARLFSVDPGTGKRTVLTDCSNTALGPCSQPEAVTVIQ
jgi:hypothetical protein